VTLVLMGREGAAQGGNGKADRDESHTRLDESDLENVVFGNSASAARHTSQHGHFRVKESLRFGSG
jgi:hypothetical protein